MAGRFSVEAIFKAIDRVTAPVNRMQNRVSKFTRSAQRGFFKLNKTIDKFGRGIKRGAAVAGVAIAGLGVVMGNIINAGADFGRAIGSAAAKFPDKIKRGTDEFKALEQAARDVGATTEFTATQAARGLNFLAKAGKSAAFSIKALSDIVDFATASEMDFAEAADIATDALGAFGLDSKDEGKAMEGLRRVMDVMSKTANSTNVSVAEMFETIKKGAPVAIKAGQSVETFAAVTGVLAGVGIKASEAGTATKNIALALAGVGNQAGKTFKKLGIALSKSGKMRDVADVFEDLNDAVKGMDEDKLLTVMNAIFGKISLAAAANLLGEGAQKIRTLRTTLESAQGSTKTTAAFIRNDVKGSIDGLSSAIEGVKISIFSLNEGPLKDAIDGMTKWVRENEKLIAGNIGKFMAKLINNLGTIVDWLKKIGIGLAVFVTFATAVKAATVAVTAFNLVLAINPFVAIIIGAIALVTWIDEIIESFEKLPGVIQLVLLPLELLLKAIKGIKDVGAIVGGKLGSLLFDMFGNDPENVNTNTGATGPQIISPQERIATSIEEQRTTSTSEVTIKTEPGTSAEVTRGKLGSGLQLQPSGGF